MKEYLQKIIHYTAGNLFQKILLLIILPIFTHFLIPEEYAVYANLMIFISFASLIYFLGIQQALFSYFYHKKTAEYHYTLISSTVITIICVGSLLSLIIIILRDQISQLILRTTVDSDILIWVGVILFFDVIFGLVLSILNMLEKSKQYVIVGNSKHVLFFIVIIIMAILSKITVRNVFLLMTITSGIAVIFALMAISSLMKKYRREIEKPALYSFHLMKRLLSFGLIMIPGTLAMMILKVSDRYMLTYLSAGALHDVGIYALGYRIGMIITFLNSIVSLVYFPYAMKNSDNEASKRSYRKVFKYYVFAGGMLGVLVLLFTPELFKIFIDPAYSSAIPIVVFGVVSNYFYGIFNIVNLSFYVKKRAKNIAFAVGAGAFMNIILNLLLIPRFGIYGAGIASVIAFGFILFMNFIIAERIYPVGYSFWLAIIMSVILAIISLLHMLVEYHVYQTFIKLGITVLLCLSFLVFNIRSGLIAKFFQRLRSS